MIIITWIKFYCCLTQPVTIPSRVFENLSLINSFWEPSIAIKQREGDRQRDRRSRVPSIAGSAHFVKIQLFKEKLSKSQPPSSSQPRDEQIALRSVKDLSIDTPTAKVANRPPPVVIRRKQIPPPIEEGKQRDSSVADSSVSDEGARSIREEPSERFISGRKRKDRGHSRRGGSRYEREEYNRGTFEFLVEDDGDRARSAVVDRSRGKWGLLPKSASTNGTARVFAETVRGGGTTSTSTTSSSSYERDLQSLLCVRPRGNSNFTSEAGTSAGGAGERRFSIRISGSTSSDLQGESELSSEERDALIEGLARTPSSVCRNRIPKFGARRRVVAAPGSSAAKDYYPRTAGDRVLDLNEDLCRVSATTTVAAASGSLAKQQNVHVINETVHVINETDTYPDDLLSSSQKPTSAPTTLSLSRKLTSWTKEGKDLLVKSVSSANTLAPTTMTCIKSPRAMSEHLLGQLDVPVAPTTAVLGALRVKGGSLKEGDRSEKMADIPRQRWSSVRVKGGSTKSLLLENGGPQQSAIKGGLTKEVFRTNVSRVN